ncbi:nucleotidyltransferase [Paenibacillus sp. CAA11]|uniref:nucleotidyltransferase n=1 Tax=Paenibacillus sp. CAA11 TaxID=1532905 RepID=UPI000D3CC444|nr:nucleotidyltransferase [Paenibacillus sp. CAA11]AWB44249.1 nucleotidyltransferase [Paenibacillus sp. CAA11]
MNIVGIVVEYNPFHYGHAHHLAEAKRITKAESVVAVMSGNFLQRGEPAIVDKWARAEMALRLGVDLVLELPIAYSSQSAEWFARGAAAILHGTGVVSHLCFGSEAGHTQELAELAELLAHEPGDLKALIAEELSGGAAYPAAYAAAAARLAAARLARPAEHVRDLMLAPNNSLGLHYMIALQRLGSAIKPVTIPREGAGYLDPLPGAGPIASATAIRRLLLGPGGLSEARRYMPEAAADILSREFAAGRGPVTWEHFRTPLFHELLTRSPKRLAHLHEMTEGLEYRLYRVLPELPEPTVEALLDALKTKRYTRTKLQRLLVHLLLQHEHKELDPASLSKGPRYLRVLGFTDRGQQLLKQMKSLASLPVITRPQSFSDPMLELDLRSAAVYNNAMQDHSTAQLFREFRQAPIRC